MRHQQTDIRCTVRFPTVSFEISYPMSCIIDCQWCRRRTNSFYGSLVAPPDGSARRSPLTSTSSLSTTATSDGISVAFVLMMIGRILNGFGAANEALRDAYLSDTIPNEPFTSTLLLINIARILGMALSPGFQFLLDKVNFTISIPPWLRPISA